MRYLIFVETGGEMESPTRSYMYYYICEGNSIIDAIKDWDNKVDQYMELTYKNWIEEKQKHLEYMQSIIKDYKEFEERNGIWYTCGRRMQIIELKDNEGFNTWKDLQWQ